MNIFIFGPPGSGKTTHSEKISQIFSLRHLDIGQLIRTEAQKSSPKAELIDHLANRKGRLLPEGIIIDLLIEHLDRTDYEHLLLDGLPRTLKQYHAILSLFSTRNSQIDAGIYLDISDQVSIDRVLARHRPDDQPQAIAHRLEEFHRQVDPILESMQSDGLLKKVDATPKPSVVTQEITAFLVKINQQLPFPRQSTYSPRPLVHSSQSATPTKSSQPGNFRNLYVLTHSESDYNKRHIFTGRLDVKLTKTGLEKARIAAKILKDKPIDLAIRTSLIRTKQTLDIILQHHPHTKVIIDDRFIERDYGDLSGQSKDEYAKKHPDLYPIYHRSYDVPPPGGESMVVVEKRVLAGLKEVIAKIKKEKINVLIVAHGNSIRPIRRYFEKLTPEEMMKLENLRHQIFTYQIPV